MRKSARLFTADRVIGRRMRCGVQELFALLIEARS
jgi:hypothetical protein